MKAVVKLGGALFKRDPDVDALRTMGKILSGFVGEGNQLVADVGGVYTADPKKNPKAKMLRSVGVDKLLSWAMAGDVYAGKYELLDPVALKIMQRARIPTRFVSLDDPSNITSALRGRDIGTLVSYS